MFFNFTRSLPVQWHCSIYCWRQDFPNSSDSVLATVLLGTLVCFVTSFGLAICLHHLPSASADRPTRHLPDELSFPRADEAKSSCYSPTEALCVNICCPVPDFTSAISFVSLVWTFILWAHDEQELPMLQVSLLVYILLVETLPSLFVITFVKFDNILLNASRTK